MTQPIICRFQPLDTWFFRESRPQGAHGSSEMGSVFPPPIRTLAGALRTALGDAWHQTHGTTWRQLAELDELQALIGNSEHTGQLRFCGPWLSEHGERLMPAPATLMAKDEHYFLLAPGEPVQCDLGTVALPAFPDSVAGLDSLAGARPASQCWLTQQGWQQLLQGRAPDASQVRQASDIFTEEPRLGIGRDNQRAAVSHGLLYQTRHLRLREGIAVEIDVSGLPDALPLADQVVRLGGEGRMAAMTLHNPIATPAPTWQNDQRTVLYLTSPMRAANALPAGVPAGFMPQRSPQGVDSWTGTLAGQQVHLHSVACGRVLREGGWDLARHAARPVLSYLPAGTALFVDLPDAQQAVTALHGVHIGEDVTLGRGQLAVGRY